MKDLTHYFADSFKTSDTPPAEPAGPKDEVSVRSAKVSEVDTKTVNSKPAPKKRCRKKGKSASPDTNNLKKTKCDLDIIKSKPANGTNVALPKNISKDTSESPSAESSLKITEQPQEHGQLSNDLVPEEENDVRLVKNCENEKNPVEIEESHDGNVDNNTSSQTSEKEEPGTVPTTQDDEKKKRKEKIQMLAEKKGYAKRKQIEDEETEEMEKILQSRKNVFSNLSKKDENQTEIVHKPPAYSLLNYFSKATPEQKKKEELAKCKISVKAEVHTPKECDSVNQTPNSTPKSHCPKSSQSKKKKAEIKQALSKMDEIQFVRSESLSPPSILQEKKKPNKPKWRIQFQSNNFTDCGSESEASSPKCILKVQKENKESEEKGESVISNDLEKSSKSENSDTETLQLHRKDRSARHKSKKKKEDESEADEKCTRKKKTKEENRVSSEETKGTDSDVDKIDNSANEIMILEEIPPKRSAPEKIAPLFIKKRKLDPAVLEARKLFLQSDMSEHETRPAKRKSSPVRNPSLPFPQISHVTQLDSAENSETSKIKLALKSPCKYSPSLEVSRFNNLTSKNDSIITRWITVLDTTKSSADIEEALREIESRCDDAMAMWKIISETAKAGSSKKSPKVRTSKRKATAKKIDKTEEVSIIDNHDNVWICKYKPMSTQEIVGNEQAATKLKNWLDKWKTPLNTDNVSSDEDFYSSDGSCSFSGDDFNQVAVLLGPHGCGKTASVYAVAEELGYSVLEINASSKRTGKRILKELEEATKSHRIKKSEMKQTFLKTKNEERKIPQNSLILMEDVDIVFEEDEGFVSAAFQLASNTKRPIVMICNEMCSHLSKLAPQQLHIQFQASAGKRASALLELISLAETGRQLSIPCVENLLENGDLRKALLQLQYLLASGRTHILPPVVDAQHRFGIPLWRKMHQCLYKPAVKSNKKRKKKASASALKDSDNRHIDVLSQLANDLESISLVSRLIGIDDLSWNSRKTKSVMSLSLSEDTSSYSYLNSVSSDIADWLTLEVIHKKEDSEQSSDQISSRLLMKKTVDAGINSVLSQIALSTTNQRIILEDYLPAVRTICRAEETRNSSNNKRGNRFFHYLHGTKMPTNSYNILSAACKVLQEKPEKV